MDLDYIKFAKLKGASNYNNWKVYMRGLLISKKYWFTVTGDELKPSRTLGIVPTDAEIKSLLIELKD